MDQPTKKRGRPKGPEKIKKTIRWPLELWAEIKAAALEDDQNITDKLEELVRLGLRRRIHGN